MIEVRSRVMDVNMPKKESNVFYCENSVIFANPYVWQSEKVPEKC